MWIWRNLHVFDPANPNELFTIKVILLAQDGEYEYLQQYVEFFENKNYLTEHQDVSNFVTKDELPVLDEYAKLEDVEGIVEGGWRCFRRLIKGLMNKSKIKLINCTGNVLIGLFVFFVPFAGNSPLTTVWAYSFFDVSILV